MPPAARIAPHKCSKREPSSATKVRQTIRSFTAHLLLQIRTRVLNDTLADDYRRWYPDFTHTTDQEHLAA